MMVERLSKMQVAYGLAMETQTARTGHPVSTLIVHSSAPLETTACVLHIDVRQSRLRLRFQMDKAACQEQPAFEITFVAAGKDKPLFVARARRI